MTEQIQDWLGYLEEKEDEEMNNTIRSNTRTGMPAWDDGFAQTIEGIVGRRPKAMPKGRFKRA